MNGTTPRLAFLLTAIAASILVASTGCDRTAPPPTIVAANADYVDDALCADCHEDLAESYREVGMARAVVPAATDHLDDDELDTYYHEPSRRTYETFLHDNRLHLRRYQLDADGARINELTQPIDWVIGSGNKVRSYAYENPAGELFAAPINLYTGLGLGMAPGYDFKDHFGFTRPIPRTCVFCHDAYPAVPAGSDRFGHAERFGELPHGIGCQRCHGPGKEHVELAVDGADDAQILASIVNPGKLEPARRDDVCNQCHLQPTAKTESRYVRFGRGAFDYRPGENLADYWVHLDFRSPHDGDDRDRFEINHHAYRLRQSPCFRQSDGKLGCTSCHDPHRRPPAAEIRAHTSSQCQQCHPLDAAAHVDEQGGGDPGDCVTCHMPTRRTEDVVHALMTDHRIQRGPVVPGAMTAPRSESPKDRTAQPFPYHEAQRHDPHMPVYLAAARVREGDSDAADDLAAALAAVPELVDPEPWLYLAGARVRNGEHAAARTILERQLAADPNLAPALLMLASDLRRRGEHGRALALVDRAVAVDPRAPPAQLERGLCLDAAGRTDDALAALRESIRLRPLYYEAHRILGDMLLRAGETGAAIDSYRNALAVEPASAAAYTALCRALIDAQQLQEAVRYLRHGVTVTGGAPPIVDLLARTLLLGFGGEPQAIAEGLQWASRLAGRQPRSAQAALLLGLGLVLSQRFERARLQADACERLGADRASCGYLRTMAWVGLGKADQARRAFADAEKAKREPPTSPSLRATLERGARGATGGG